MSSNNYKYEMEMQKENRLFKILSNLPDFVSNYFRSISTTKSINTRLVYAYDINTFFNWLVYNVPYFKKYKGNLKKMQVSELNKINLFDLEKFQTYLKSYTNLNGTPQINSESGIAQKLSALRSFFKYFYKHNLIENNQSDLLENPKLHDKVIIRMSNDEVNNLINYINNCEDTISNHQKAYYKKTRQRDLMIIILMLNTGIRVSECVGLNIEDVIFTENCIKILRKGGNEMFIYFNDEVKNQLYDYINNYRLPLTDSTEPALFLSIQKKRISTKAVQNLVKKYTRYITNKHITPHKLRSTYGTALYKETGDIYLVADVLGHKNVNTTKKHYAALDDDRRKFAATKINWNNKETKNPD